MLLGTLKMQIMYPNIRSQASNTSTRDYSDENEEYFLGLLRKVKLENLASRMGNGDEKLGLLQIQGSKFVIYI